MRPSIRLRFGSMSLKECTLFAVAILFGSCLGACGHRMCRAEGDAAAAKDASSAVVATPDATADASADAANATASADGADSMAGYSIEFMPYLHQPGESGSAEGTLVVNRLMRADRNAPWRVVDTGGRSIAYPQATRLPRFVITDNLRVADELEGVRLSFHDKQGRLLRAVSYSVEEWLFLIGEIRRSSCGYLPVDLSGEGRDMLTALVD